MTVTEAVTLIAAVTAAIVAVANAIAQIITAQRLDEVHKIVNSQATKFESLSRTAGFAEGHAAATEEHKPPAVP